MQSTFTNFTASVERTRTLSLLPVYGLCLALATSGISRAGTPVDGAGASAQRLNMTGAWIPEVPTFLFNLAPLFAAEDPESPTPPLKGEYLERFNRNAERLRQIKAGGPLEPGEGTFRPEVNCPPPSMPQMMLVGFDLVVTNQVVYLIGYGHASIGASGAIRHIFIEGKGPPALHDKQESLSDSRRFTPGYVGHSVGHWDRQTLIIDTVGLVENRIDGQEERPQAQHSDQLHITERLRLISSDILEDEVTLVDNKALTKPWTSTIRYHRIPVRKADGEFQYCEANAGAREF